jgi:hypothetical protein
MSLPPKWKYHLLFLSNERENAQVQHAMNELGLHGWEFVAVTDAGDNAKIFIFKQSIG